MMRFALNYRDAIDSITADKTLNLRKYELFTEDWDIIQDLANILQQYKAATIHFSKNSASIATVIPTMDRLTDGLNTVTKKPYHAAIKAAMKLARAKMNRYYSLTDSSSAYRIAMVLHPGMKLEYFRQHKWEDDWVDEAENLVREEYIGRYELMKEGDDVPVTNEKLSDIDVFDIANLSVLPCTAHASEIDEYLRFPIETCRDPLKWWIDSWHVYPNLSKMALDYLSIPSELNLFLILHA